MHHLQERSAAVVHWRHSNGKNAIFARHSYQRMAHLKTHHQSQAARRALDGYVVANLVNPPLSDR